MEFAVMIIELDWVSHVIYFQWLKLEFILSKLDMLTRWAMKNIFFSTDVNRSLKYQSSTKIIPVGAELMLKDRWTGRRRDMTKLRGAFRNLWGRA
jgi:hypothetical protein